MTPTSASSCSQYLGRHEVARQGWSGASSQIAHAWPVMDNDSDDDVLLLLHLRRRRKKAKSKHRRRMWVRPIFQQRLEQGDFHQLLQELRRNDPESHFRFLRMSKETFDCLVEKVTPSLTTRSYQSGTRAEISPAERYPRSLYCNSNSVLSCLSVCLSTCLPRRISTALGNPVL